MTTTARELIAEAYYISGVVSQEQQEVSGPEETAGLRALNRAIAVESITGALIPFYKQYEFNFVPGQEKYEIDNLIDIENIVYIFGSVRYRLRHVKRNDYFSRGRVEGITTLPSIYHFERAEDKGEIYVFFPPNSDYEVKLWGKFGFAEVPSVDTDLSTLYSREYLTYLSFLLAKYICIAFDETLPEQAQVTLNEIIDGMHFVSPIDLTVQKNSVFDDKYLLDYTSANLFNGWWPA